MYMKIEDVPTSFCEKFCNAWNKKKKCCNRWSNPYANQFCLWTKEEMMNEMARAEYDDDCFRGTKNMKARNRKRTKTKREKEKINNGNFKKKSQKSKLQF